jgi:hypothetical protein
MKRYERDISKINWYQNESGQHPIMCPKHDLMKMEPAHHYGGVYLYCPFCSYQINKIPDHIYKAYYEKVFLQTQI